MKAVFSVLFAVGLILGISINASCVREDALVLYYSFDAGIGDAVEDLSGNGHDGDISGNPEWIDSDFGKALFFEGKAQTDRQYIDIHGILPIGDMDNTLSMWVRVPPDSNGGGTNRVGILLGNYNKSMNSNWELHGNGQVRIWWNNGQHDLKGNKDLRDDEWHHIVFVRSKAEERLEMYVDRQLDAMIASAGTDVVWQDEHRVAGDKRGDDSPWFHGAIDELAIWNVVLSEDEIEQLADGVLLAVYPAGKLGTTWCRVKSGY
jgi:hypothetical protein